MRRLALLLLCATACSKPQPNIGIDVFANDTTPVKFVVTVTGTLEVALRSNAFYMRPDKSLVLETPGSLLYHKGDGMMTIQSFDSTTKIAVEPLNTAPEFSERAAIVGTVVSATVAPDDTRIVLKLERP
jgi:hypothetical protein